MILVKKNGGTCSSRFALNFCHKSFSYFLVVKVATALLHLGQLPELRHLAMACAASFRFSTSSTGAGFSDVSLGIVSDVWKTCIFVRRESVLLVACPALCVKSIT